MSKKHPSTQPSRKKRKRTSTRKTPVDAKQNPSADAKQNPSADAGQHDADTRPPRPTRGRPKARKPSRNPHERQAPEQSSTQATKESETQSAPQEAPTEGSFYATLRALQARKGPDAQERADAPLATLPYPTEVACKEEALTAFWKQHGLSGTPDPLVQSPRPRAYRTSTKRNAELRGHTLTLSLPGERVSKKYPFHPSPLEPEEHAVLYSFVQEKLSTTPFHVAARHLNTVIIRGSYRQRTVIFNVDAFNGPVIRKYKLIAKHLQALPSPPISAFLYLDPSRSEYHFEQRKPTGRLQFKKLYGPDHLQVSFEDQRYRFHPTSFSQINESIVPLMLQHLQTLLQPSPDASLLDLYCGYGLFTHFFAPLYRHTLGIDVEGHSIEAAKNNRPPKSTTHPRFMARPITADLIAQLHPAKGPETILLDPPRHGPQEGVIAALCERKPHKVLHIFCGIEEIPDALQQWKEGGYHVQHITPIDMFPATAHLEVLILLTPTP